MWLQCSRALLDRTPRACNTDPHPSEGIYPGAYSKSFPGVQTRITEKKSRQLQWKYRKCPIISLGADLSLPVWKTLTHCRMANTMSWVVAHDITSMGTHRTTSRQCWWELRVPAARWEGLTILGRRNLLHFQQNEAIWRNYFWGEYLSVPAGFHALFTRLRLAP